LKNNEVLLLLFAVIYTRIWKSVDFFEIHENRIQKKIISA